MCDLVWSCDSYIWVENGQDGSEPKSVPLPKEVLDKFSPSFCELCKLPISCPSAAFQHYEGKAHMKKVTLHMKESYNVLGTLSVKEMSTPTQCEICNVGGFTGKVTYLSHITGQKHLKNLKKHGELPAPSDSWAIEAQPNIESSSNPGMITPHSVATTGSGYMTSAGTGSGHFFPSDLDDSLDDPFSFMKNLPPPPPLPKLRKYECSLCEITTATRVQMETHNKTALHVSNVANLPHGELKEYFQSNSNCEPPPVESVNHQMNNSFPSQMPASQQPLMGPPNMGPSKTSMPLLNPPLMNPAVSGLSMIGGPNIMGPPIMHSTSTDPSFMDLRPTAPGTSPFGQPPFTPPIGFSPQYPNTRQSDTFMPHSEFHDSSFSFPQSTAQNACTPPSRFKPNPSPRKPSSPPKEPVVNERPAPDDFEMRPLAVVSVMKLLAEEARKEEECKKTVLEDAAPAPELVTGNVDCGGVGLNEPNMGDSKVSNQDESAADKSTDFGAIKPAESFKEFKISVKPPIKSKMNSLVKRATEKLLKEAKEKKKREEEAKLNENRKNGNQPPAVFVEPDDGTEKVHFKMGTEELGMNTSLVSNSEKKEENESGKLKDFDASAVGINKEERVDEAACNEGSSAAEVCGENSIIKIAINEAECNDTVFNHAAEPSNGSEVDDVNSKNINTHEKSCQNVEESKLGDIIPKSAIDSELDDKSVNNNLLEEKSANSSSGSKVITDVNVPINSFSNKEDTKNPDVDKEAGDSKKEKSDVKQFDVSSGSKKSPKGSKAKRSHSRSYSRSRSRSRYRSSRSKSSSRSRSRSGSPSRRSKSRSRSRRKRSSRRYARSSSVSLSPEERNRHSYTQKLGFNKNWPSDNRNQFFTPRSNNNNRHRNNRWNNRPYRSYNRWHHFVDEEGDDRRTKQNEDIDEFGRQKTARDEYRKNERSSRKRSRGSRSSSRSSSSRSVSKSRSRSRSSSRSRRHNREEEKRSQKKAEFKVKRTVTKVESLPITKKVSKKVETNEPKRTHSVQQQQPPQKPKLNLPAVEKKVVKPTVSKPKPEDLCVQQQTIETEAEIEERKKEMQVNDILRQVALIRRKLLEQEEEEKAEKKRKKKKEKSKKKKKKRASSTSSSSSSSSSSSGSSSSSIPTALIGKLLDQLNSNVHAAQSSSNSAATAAKLSALTKAVDRKSAKKKKKKDKKEKKSKKKAKPSQHQSSLLHSCLSSYLTPSGTYYCSMCEHKDGAGSSFIQHLMSDKHKFMYNLVKNRQAIKQ